MPMKRSNTPASWANRFEKPIQPLANLRSQTARLTSSLKISVRQTALPPCTAIGRESSVFSPDIFERSLDSLIANCISILRSEEHTSELQSRPHLVCRLL